MVLTLILSIQRQENLSYAIMTNKIRNIVPNLPTDVCLHIELHFQKLTAQCGQEVSFENFTY